MSLLKSGGRKDTASGKTSEASAGTKVIVTPVKLLYRILAFFFGGWVALIAVILAVVIAAASAAASVVSSTTVSNISDPYYNAYVNVKNQYLIKNTLNPSMAKVIDAQRGYVRTDVTEIAALIFDNYVVLQPGETSVTSKPEGESSVPESTLSAPPAVTYLFKTEEQIFEMLRGEPYNFTESDIEQLQEILAAGFEYQAISSAGEWGPATDPQFWNNGNITSGFGPREGNAIVSNFHHGLDISFADCYGKNIYAAKAGTVVIAAADHSDYGTYVSIDHGGGYTTLYGHMSELGVYMGQQVSQGQYIGKIGNTGKSTGAHLHYEIAFNGERKDPIAYYQGDLSTVVIKEQ